MLRIFLLPVMLCLAISSYGQKAKIFKTTDFDLTGKVKSCLVITDYGKEEFSFNEKGILTKLVTRYNDTDYDITYYKFANGEITEKRVENYRDGVFDKNTSIANIYVIDTISTGRTVIEKIVSYAKEFLDQYEYTYDEEGKLTAILRNYNDGIENTLVTYEKLSGELTTTYTLDGQILKTVRTSERKTKANLQQKVELTKEFLEGKPNKAIEQVFNANGKLLSENTFLYDTVSNSFVSKELKTYNYNKLEMLLEQKTTTDKVVEIKKFIYQYDAGEKGNWIKQIITPDNTFISRKIKYYEPIVAKE